jgi:AcrR family transcriptional regulator
MGAPVLISRRTDARRNRQEILRVADQAFAEGSAAVSFEEIARRAGLSRATVYRHFPDRQALGKAIAAEQLSALRRIVGAPDAERRSFRELLQLVLWAQVSRRALVHLLRELPEREQRQHANALIAILTVPLRQAQAEGQLRPDAQPTDLALIFEMIEAAVRSAPASTNQDVVAQRLITVILDGLCSGGTASEITPPALSSEYGTT